jgi:histidinol phosphatase-like enzyme (inositol monophosphatase family)
MAVEAGDVTLQHFGGILQADTKADGSPVTVADRAAETLLRERIGSLFPEHGILGEELGRTNPEAPVQWILDPIDGTRAFTRGVPIFGVLVGVFFEGAPILGVAHFPALRETLAGALGCGSEWNGRQARVSEVADLSGAAVLTTDLEEILKRPGLDRAWEDLVRDTSISRTWGDCYGHALVATGRAEVMIDPILSPWDSAPFVPILKEAGGIFTDLEGTAEGTLLSGLSTNGLLHQAILERLQKE